LTRETEFRTRNSASVNHFSLTRGISGSALDFRRARCENNSKEISRVESRPSAQGSAHERKGRKSETYS
jgi:hypothetical protein